MMSMFDEGADELVFPILKSNATHADLFRSYRNQTAKMVVELQKKLLDDLTKRDHDQLIQANNLLKRKNDELLKENGALQYQLQL